MCVCVLLPRFDVPASGDVGNQDTSFLGILKNSRDPPNLDFKRNSPSR